MSLNKVNKQTGETSMVAGLGGTPTDLGTAATCDYTTTITQGSDDLPTGGAVYNYIDTMITQALTGSY